MKSSRHSPKASKAHSTRRPSPPLYSPYFKPAVEKSTCKEETPSALASMASSDPNTPVHDDADRRSTSHHDDADRRFTGYHDESDNGEDCDDLIGEVSLPFSAFFGRWPPCIMGRGRTSQLLPDLFHQPPRLS